MNKFSTKLNALHNKHKQELKTEISQYLNIEFKEYFVKHPLVKTVKINTSTEYDDNDYTDRVHADVESIHINGYSYYSMENDDIDDDELLKKVGLTPEQHTFAAEDAEVIFAQIDEDILKLVYGTSFGLKVSREGVTVESSDVEGY